MKVTVQFKYDGPINDELDKHIRWQAEKLGWHEWASGTDLETGVRDLTFDMELAEDAFPAEKP